ncbi:hypothetical protein G4D82_07780 [Flavobacterium sp. CYK-4]|uniref:hypothetical protein n=1 Tax=Flavobacterium lotistagni TaxID=2709660 RepID=UPI0014086F51|nr:hypothetical protein [Flavobacterium lotistagni]NHM07117.1 hypothetical protein [Flavobacterium lotistagni]
MIAQINTLIDSKLHLLFHAENQILPLLEFKKSGKSKLQDAKILAEMMQFKGLISPYPEKENHYQLTDFGRQICEQGGWCLYLEQLQNKNSGTEIAAVALSVEKTSWKQSVKSFLQSLMKD